MENRRELPHNAFIFGEQKLEPVSQYPGDGQYGSQYDARFEGSQYPQSRYTVSPWQHKRGHGIVPHDPTTLSQAGSNMGESVDCEPYDQSYAGAHQPEEPIPVSKLNADASKREKHKPKRPRTRIKEEIVFLEGKTDRTPDEENKLKEMKKIIFTENSKRRMLEASEKKRIKEEIVFLEGKTDRTPDEEASLRKLLLGQAIKKEFNKLHQRKHNKRRVIINGIYYLEGKKNRTSQEQKELDELIAQEKIIDKEVVVNIVKELEKRREEGTITAKEQKELNELIYCKEKNRRTLPKGEVKNPVVGGEATGLGQDPYNSSGLNYQANRLAEFWTTQPQQQLQEPTKVNETYSYQYGQLQTGVDPFGGPEKVLIDLFKPPQPPKRFEDLGGKVSL